MKKSTEDLMKTIEKTNNIEDYFSENEEDLMFDTLKDYLEFYLIKKNKKKSDVLERSQIQKNYGYEIFRGDKIPSRDKLIMLLIGLDLTLEEAQQVLKRFTYGTLYPRDRRDSIIIHGFLKHYSIMEINDILFSLDFEILE